jgi:hypothetical protein
VDFFNAKLTIPAGRLLVIEHITTRVSVDPGDSLESLFLQTGDGFTVFLDAKPSTCAAHLVCYSSHQPIRVYAKKSLMFLMSVNNVSGSHPFLNADVSGYLLDPRTRLP